MPNLMFDQLEYLLSPPGTDPAKFIQVDSDGLPVAPGSTKGGGRSANNLFSQFQVRAQQQAFDEAQPVRARTAERRKRQIIANQNRLIRTTSMGASVRDMTLGGEVLLATR